MATKDFSTELQEFITIVSGPLGEGETILIRLQHAADALDDVVGRLVDDLDDENRDEELAALTLAVQNAAAKALNGVPNIGRFARVALQSALPVVIPVLVEGAASKAEPAVFIRDRYVVPAYDKAIIFLLRSRSSLSPDAGPLAVPAEVYDGIVKEADPGPASPAIAPVSRQVPPAAGGPARPSAP